MKRVAVIVLTYNSLSKLGSLFDRTLQSVLSQDYPDIKVVIVDNASRDGTPDHAQGYCERAGWEDRCGVVRLPRNHGWSGGNNRGAILARDADYLLFMNDDVVLEPDTVSRLIEAIEGDERLGAVQPLIVNRDGSVYCGFKLGLSGYPKTIVSPADYALSKVFFVSGAALLTRASVFRGVGMFDEDLFLYHDDVDYCWRLHLAGYSVACVPEARAYHYGSATFGSESPTYLYYLMRNNVWVAAKNSTLPWFLLRLYLATLEALISFIAYYAMDKRDPERTIAIVKGLLDGLRGLRVPFSKRWNVRNIRRISERGLNKVISVSVDFELIIPYRLRKVLKTILSLTSRCTHR